LRTVETVTTGTFLVASPALRDPNFVRTVVLMCEHGPGGSWGLVVNRRTDLTFGDLLDDLPFPAQSEARVFWGGPVEPSRMQTLHRLRHGTDLDVPVCAGVNLGLDADTFRQVVANALLPGEALQTYVGHSGWGPGQLDAELAMGSWITCTADASFVFDTDPADTWERVLRALGPGYARLASVPLDPRIN